MSASRQIGERQRTSAAWIIGAGLVLTVAVVGVMQLLHGSSHEAVELAPLLHWLRDSALALPAVTMAVAVAALPRVRRLANTQLPGDVRAPAWALVVSAGIAIGLVPGNVVHQWLFVSADHEHAMGTVEHVVRDAASGMLVALVVALVISVAGTSWSSPPPIVLEMLPSRAAVLRVGARVTVAGGTGALVVAGLAVPAQSQDVVTQAVPDGPQCTGANTVLASVVALDQPFDYNRLGATNPAGMMFALRHDVVLKSDTGGYDAGTPVTLTENLTGAQLAGNVALRADKRPRPLALRMTVGQCLEIAFQNLLGTTPADGEQPADRNVGVHVKGLAVVNGVQDDGTFVGENASSLAAPGEEKIYTLYGEHENGYVLDNGAAGLPREDSFSEEELWEVARARAKARRDLSAQVLLFALVNAFLWLAWALTAGPEFSLAASPIWVTFGWGAIVTLNAWSVHHPKVTDDDIQREFRALHRQHS